MGFPHGLKRQFNTSRQRGAEGGGIRLLCVAGNAGQGIDDVLPALAVDGARNRPGNHHGPGDGEVRFMRRAGGQRDLPDKMFQPRRR